MLYEPDTFFRQIFMDGRKHPDDPQPSYLGSSVGRWEGDSLVVETVGFNDRGPLDAMGHRHSDAMRVTERWTFVDQNTLDYKATVDDPKVYTKPWTIGVTHTRNAPGSELMEYAGVEGDADAREAEAISRAQAKKAAPKKK